MFVLLLFNIGELLTIIHNKCKYVCYAILYLFSKYIQNADLALF